MLLETFVYFYFQKGDRVKNKFTKFSVFRNITKILASLR